MNEEQPMPTGAGTRIFPLVKADLLAREQQGVRTYGTDLRANNGRDALRDAYEEAMDMVLYLRQAIQEREEAKARSAFGAAGQEAEDIVTVGVLTSEMRRNLLDLSGLISSELEKQRLAIEAAAQVEKEKAEGAVSLAQAAANEAANVKLDALDGLIESVPDMMGLTHHVNITFPDGTKTSTTPLNDTPEMPRAETAREFIKRTTKTTAGSFMVDDRVFGFVDQPVSLWPQDYKPPVPPESIAQEAHRLVLGDRGDAYGHPIFDMTRSADMVTSLLRAKLRVGERLEAEDIGQVMICVKQSRHRNAPKRDNLTDTAGYALTLQMIKEWRDANPGVDPRDRF
jgi:hypothetical protein